MSNCNWNCGLITCYGCLGWLGPDQSSSSRAPSWLSTGLSSLEEFIKRTGKVTRQRTKFRGKIIRNRGTHNRESPFLSGGSASTWHEKVPLGGRAERSATRAGPSQVEELQKIRRRVTKNIMPDNRRDP